MRSSFLYEKFSPTKFTDSIISLFVNVNFEKQITRFATFLAKQNKNKYNYNLNGSSAYLINRIFIRMLHLMFVCLYIFQLAILIKTDQMDHNIKTVGIDFASMMIQIIVHYGFVFISVF